MNYEQKLDELLAKHTAEQLALQKEYAVLSALPPALVVYDWSVHMHRLYDRDGSAHLRMCQCS